MICEEFRNDAAALALGALSPEEALDSRAHLSSCDACAAEYRSSTAVVERLPLAVPIVRAPAALRAAVFAAIHAESSSSTPAAPAQPLRGSPTAIHAVPAERHSENLNAARASSGTSRRSRSFLAAGFHVPALAAAFVGLTIVGLTAWTAWLQLEVHDLRRPQVVAAAPPANAPPSAALAAEANSLMLISAPGTVRAQLVNHAAAGPSGAVFWNPDQRRCVVIARQLAPADPGQEYRVWIHTGSQSWDGGPVTPDAQGVAETILPTDRWQVYNGYTVSIVLQPVPADGTRRTVLTGDLLPTTQ